MTVPDPAATSPLPVAAADVEGPASVASPAAPPTRVRTLILALACGISFVLYLHRYTWGFVKPKAAAEFGWDPVTLGWLDSLFTVTYGAAQVPSGMLCDWFGAHLFLGTSILLWSVALGGVAWANGLASMAVARLTFGMAQAGCYPVLNKVSKSWFPLSMRTTAQGWIATFFGRSGGAMSFFLFGTVMLGWWGLPWRWAIAIFSVLGILCGALFMLLFRNTPQEHPWVNEAEARLISGDLPAVPATRSRLRWGQLFGSVSIWFLLLRAFASNMADVVYVYWVPTYLLEEKQLDHSAAGWLSALPLIGGALGGLFSGSFQSLLIRRTGNRRWARSGLGLSGKMIAAVLTLLSLVFVNPLAVVAMLMTVKFFSDWEQPAEWGTISDIAGPNAATVFGCVNTMGSLGGVVAGPLIGWILGAFGPGKAPTTAGWTALFVVMALEYAIAASSWLFIDCRRTLNESQILRKS